MLTRRGVSIVSSTLGLVAASALAFDALFSTVTLFILSVIGLESLLYFRSLRRSGLLKSEVKTPATTAFVGDEFPLQIEIKNTTSSRMGPILITGKIPHGFKVTSSRDEWIQSLGRDETYLMEYTLEALQMGDWTLGEAEIVLTDRFGMFKRGRSLNVGSKIRVYPSMRRGEELLKGRIHMGMRPLRRSSISTPLGSEFSGIRDYYPGDDYRMIAWKAIAKSSTRSPKTKEHEYEQSLNVTLVLLNSETIGEGLVGGRKLDSVAEASLALSHLSLKTGGDFKVVYWKKDSPEIVEGRPLQIASRLYGVTPESTLDPESLLNVAINASKPRSLLLIFLDSPIPRTIDPMILRRASLRYQFLHVLLLDSTSFLEYQGTDEAIEMASKIISDQEQRHLDGIISLLAANGISAQTCKQTNLLNRALDVFQSASLVLEV